jgi:hypothetical protein
MCFGFPAILGVQVAEVLAAAKYQQEMKPHPGLASSIWVQKTVPQPSALALVMVTGTEESDWESSRGRLHKSVSLKSNPAAETLSFWASR